MRYDVYLGGVTGTDWRRKVKRSLPKDTLFFDPMVKNFEKLDETGLNNQLAREFSNLENDNRVVVFYLNSEWKGTSSLLELGDVVGRGKQVVVCLEGRVRGKKDILRYCEFRGVLVVYTLKEMIEAVKGMLTELTICGV